jgi:hypothetical protein
MIITALRRNIALSPMEAQGSGGNQVLASPGQMPITIVPTTEVTQFSSGVLLRTTYNSESTAVKTLSWYCGNCYPDKQIYIKWSVAPTGGTKYYLKVQWCPWDSSVDADWVDDGPNPITFDASAAAARLIIQANRYGMYLRLKVWQNGPVDLTFDAFGLGKWS